MSTSVKTPEFALLTSERIYKDVAKRLIFNLFDSKTTIFPRRCLKCTEIGESMYSTTIITLLSKRLPLELIEQIIREMKYVKLLSVRLAHF
jgi:hypothetical protein